MNPEWRKQTPCCGSVQYVVRTKTTPRYRCRPCGTVFAELIDKKEETARRREAEPRLTVIERLRREFRDEVVA